MQSHRGHFSSSLRGSAPRGLAGIHQLPMLGLLGRGKIVVDLGGVTLGLDIGHFVDFLLRNEPTTSSMRVTTTSTATARPAAASPATSTSLSKG